MRVEFILPIYNEEKILAANVERLLRFCQSQNFNFAWQIILVVNGSSDSSWTQSQELIKKYSQSIAAVNYSEPGKGNALKKYSASSTADILVYMDIDLAVDLKNISALLQPLLNSQADIVIGSRLLPESKIERSFIREASSQTYNFLSRLILGHHFSDLQCGFKAIKSEAFKKIAPYLKDGRWFFDTELIAFGHYFNYHIKEIPVDWSENRWDERKSKINIFRDSLKFFVNLLRLRIRMMKIK